MYIRKIFLAFFFLACIACAAPSTTDKVDAKAQTIDNIRFTSDEKTYKVNDIIEVTVTFSEAVVVEHNLCLSTW